MIVYNTTFHAHNDAVEHFLEWLRAEYIPRATVDGRLSEPRLTLVLNAEESDGRNYSLQFRASDVDTLRAWYEEVGDDLVNVVNHAHDNEKRICAVGTSVMRALASAVCMNGHLMPYEGWTNKFIFPPYDFQVCTAMVSNFHMPLSTMLMMVSAFGGYDLIMEAYRVAVEEKYRFGAYGDAMLILR